MPLIVGVLCLLLVVPAVASARTLYVKWNRDVSVRSATDINSKTLATLKTGQAVNVLSTQGNYYIVTLPGGTRGYVFKEYLNAKAPAEVKPPEVAQKTPPSPQPVKIPPAVAQKTPPAQQSAQSLKTEPEPLSPQQQVREMEKQVKKLEAQLKAQDKDLLALRTERVQLEADKKQAEITANLTSELTNQLKTKQGTLEQDNQLRWFMAGAGILLTGGVLGWLWTIARQRSRPRRIFFK